MLAELLGILLALVIAGLAWGLVRLGRWVRDLVRHPWRRPVPRLRAYRLRASRRLARSQSERIAALTEELEVLRLRLRQAERAREKGMPASRWEERFQRAKRLFALRFHPDRLRTASRLERNLRTAMFREYWSELQRIERG